MKKLIVVLLLAGMFAVSGCTLFAQQGAVGAFAGGTDGIVASFMNLPTSVFAESTFGINVLLQNKGEADIPASAALLTLNNAGTLGITEASITNMKILNKVRKVSNATIPGGSDTASWQGASFKGAAITEQQTVPLGVSMCYPYETTVVALVCAGLTDKVCQPIEEKAVQSSGAPIQVTTLTQVAVPEPGGVELAFTIDIENKGKGDVYAPDAVCSGLSPDKKDIVEIKSITFNGISKTADCLNEPISLSANMGLTTCKMNISVTQDYSAELVVKLNYIYKDLLNGAITVIPL